MYTSFSELKDSQKAVIFDKYIVPTNTANIFVNDIGQAFESISGSKVGLTLKPSANFSHFHNYAGQQERKRG